MEKEIYNLRIEKVLNGYIVYTNEKCISSGTITPVPYVFETLENLNDFLFHNFNIKK